MTTAARSRSGSRTVPPVTGAAAGELEQLVEGPVMWSALEYSLEALGTNYPVTSPEP